MNIYCLTSLFSFIQNAIAHIDIKGELTFVFYPISLDVLKKARYDKAITENNILYKKTHLTTKTTVAARGDRLNTSATSKDDCVYQYPDKMQVEALLSDMMNQLTKIFVRAYEYIDKRETRRNIKRFKIVTHRFDSRFFEQAYNLMSEEFSKSVNATTDFSRFSNHNPCHHQAELKKILQNLLEQSKAILKRAAVRCVSDILRVKNRADDTRTKQKVGQLLLQEIKEVRSNQLKVLCDNFKLCYKDMLY